MRRVDPILIASITREMVPMGKFQFRNAEKFSILAIGNVYSGLSEDRRNNYQTEPGSLAGYLWKLDSSGESGLAVCVWKSCNNPI